MLVLPTTIHEEKLILVLSRKLGQEIVIDHRYIVRICNIDRGVVKLGVIADDNVAVNRSEVEDKIIHEKPATCPVTPCQPDHIPHRD